MGSRLYSHRDSDGKMKISSPESDCLESTCMDALMPLQSSGITESSLAVPADVRLLPAVNPQVPLQIP